MKDKSTRTHAAKSLIAEGRCPKGCSLINHEKTFTGKPAVTAEVRLRGKTGLIHFNPFYGAFEYDSELKLLPGDVFDLVCPHCHTVLTVSDTCPTCRVPMFAFHLPDGGEARACPKVGCHNHKLTMVDLDTQFAKYYNEERRFKM
jgi:hypothetical protein